MAINGLLTSHLRQTTHGSTSRRLPARMDVSYLEPFRIIMRINRQPLPTLRTAIRKDLSFGAVRAAHRQLDHDTRSGDLRFRRADLSSTTSPGSRRSKFIRDAWPRSRSRLRNSIAGLWAWRVNDAKTPEERKKMFKEADYRVPAPSRSASRTRSALSLHQSAVELWPGRGCDQARQTSRSSTKKTRRSMVCWTNCGVSAAPCGRGATGASLPNSNSNAATPRTWSASRWRRHLGLQRTVKATPAGSARRLSKSDANTLLSVANVRTDGRSGAARGDAATDHDGVAG